MSQAFEHVPLQAVRDYWNRRPCNVRHSPQPVGSRAYFDQVQQRKYFVEPHIPGFAQFRRWSGRRVLEIGCGIGTDTISFARHGASVTAVDLSAASLAIARRRAEVYGLQDRIRFVEADAEHLDDVLVPEPYDLVYSFGVLHHTPNPDRAFDRLRRFMDASSTLKVMVYHRRSVKVAQILARHGGRGNVARHSEAQTGCPVTHTYSRREGRRRLQAHGFDVTDMKVDHIFPYVVEHYRRHRYVRRWYWRLTPKPMFRMLERRFGWHLCMTARKTDEGPLTTGH